MWTLGRPVGRAHPRGDGGAEFLAQDTGIPYRGSCTGLRVSAVCLGRGGGDGRGAVGGGGHRGWSESCRAGLDSGAEEPMGPCRRAVGAMGARQVETLEGPGHAAVTVERGPGILAATHLDGCRRFFICPEVREGRSRCRLRGAQTTTGTTSQTPACLWTQGGGRAGGSLEGRPRPWVVVSAARRDASRSTFASRPSPPSWATWIPGAKQYLWLINLNRLPHVMSWFARGRGSLLRALIPEKKKTYKLNFY